MAGWEGFSEDDLNRMKKGCSSSDTEPAQLEEKPEHFRKVNINSASKRQKPREKIKPKVSAPRKNQNGKQMTERKSVKQESSPIPEFVSENSTPECERNFTQKQGKGTRNVEKNVILDIKPSNGNEEPGVPEIILEPERIQAIEQSALQKMQQKQTEIEGENKRKKAALQQTIKTRFKKTQAEAQTLKLVQKELAHLDNLLSADVAVLRDTIEEATRDYHYAMKRYEHAEAEFVQSKMELHRKTERKQLLTEHLYTIIQQNEQRKANKLEELMDKLNLSEDALNAGYVNEHTSTENMTTGSTCTETSYAPTTCASTPTTCTQASCASTEGVSATCALTTCSPSDCTNVNNELKKSKDISKIEEEGQCAIDIKAGKDSKANDIINETNKEET